MKPRNVIVMFGTAMALAAGLMTMSSGSANAAQKPSRTVTSLRVALDATGDALPAYVADTKGFFAKQHLKVQVTVVQNIATIPPALGKTFDIGETVPTSIIAANEQGISVVPVAGATLQETSNPQAGVVVSGSSNIKSASQLKGDTIGVENAAGTLNLATLAWLSKAGVPATSIKTIQIAPASMEGELEAGQVQAVEAVPPFMEAMKATGDRSLGSPYVALSPTIAAIGWMASKSWAASHQNVLTEFRNALNEGIAYITTNPKASKELLAKFTGISKTLAATVTFPSYTTAVRKSDWQIWLRAMRKYSGFSKSFNLNTLFPTR